jgi:iron complex outermembrane recepter protein
MKNDNAHGDSRRTHMRTLLARAVGAAVACLLSTPGALHAAVLEEITVTAQKREQSLQDVGIAISSFTGDQLRAFGVKQSFDIASFTPGVYIGGSLAGQNTQFTIRGVTQNDFNDVVEAPNAVYLDDGYIASSQAQSFAVFDIARVEILKGPQGTLFGRNATGGLVHYISNKPSYDEVEGYVDIGYGVFDSPTNAKDTTVQAAFGGPLSDRVAGRVAIMYHNQDPYLKNIYPFGTNAFTGGSPGAGAGADMGDDESKAARGILSFKMTDDVEITLLGNVANADISTGPYQSKPVIGIYDGVGGAGELINVVDAGPNETRQSIAADGTDNGRDLADLGFLLNIAPRVVPGGDFFGYVDPDGKDLKTSSDLAFEDEFSLDTWNLASKVEWAISDSTTLHWIQDYKDYEKFMAIDVDAAPVNQLGNYAEMDASSLTEELRLNGSTDSMRWVAGLYYLHIDIDSINGLKIPPGSILLGAFPGLPGVDIGVDAKLKTDSYSAFGQIEYDLNDAFTVVAGLRIMQEKKDYDMTNGFYASSSPLTVHQGGYIIPGADFEDKTSDTLWAGKAQLDWHVNDDLLVYAGVNRGVKAGSFNAPLIGNYARVGDAGLPYDEEILVSYEGGFKSTLMDGLARLNGAVFYYDYSDYQAFLFTGVGGVVINRDAENIGAELELQISPVEGLDIMLAGSWFDAEVKDVPLSLTALNRTLNVKPTYAPEFQAAGLIRYQWAALRGTMSVQADFTYSDEFYYNLRNFDADKYDSYAMFNASLGWASANEEWNVTLAARNLTDKRAGIMGYDLSNLCGCNEVSYRAPREYVANLRYSF